MRTWTIYLACSEAEKVWNPYRNENFDTYPAKRVARAERQTLKFSAELLRRMDERDAWAAQRDWDALPGPILRDAQGHKYKMPKPHILGGK